MLKANSPYSEVEWTAAGDFAPGAGGGVPLPGHRRVRPQPGGLRLPRRDHLRPVRGARVPQPDERHSAKAHSGPHHLRPGGRVGGYRYDDVFRYLKTGLTGLSAEDVDLLENYVLKWSLEGSAWTGARDWANHPRGYGLPFSEGTSPAGPAQHAAASGGPDPGGPAEEPGQDGLGAGDRPLRLSGGGGVPERLAQRTEELEPPGAGRAGGRSMPSSGRSSAAAWSSALRSWGRPHGAGRVLQALALVLSQYDVGSIPVSLDRVNVGDMPRLAHRACPVVFLLGADDGAIPRRRAVAGPAQRRRPEPAGLLRAGAGPPAVRQAVPGDDHRLRDLRPAPSGASM